MNKVTVLRLRVGFKYPCIQTKIPLLSQLLRIITWFILNTEYLGGYWMNERVDGLDEEGV
jgi:hypothetical protein